MKTVMPVELQGSTQRTKLRLSISAEEVINDDIQNFMLETNRTGFLNHLFMTLIHHSEANIDQEIDRKKQYFLSVMEKETGAAKLKNREQMEAVAIALAESYRHDLTEKYTTVLKAKPKSEEFNIRLNNDVYILLHSGEVNWENHGAYRSVRLYLEALLESYAEKPVCERELLFFSDHVLQFRQAIETKPKKRGGMIIGLRSASGAAPSENTEKVSGRVKSAARMTGQIKDYVVVPYALEPDRGNNYYYLVGMSRPLGKREMKMLPSSFRLSRIESVRLTDLEEGLSKEDCEEMQKRIEERGIQYVFAGNGQENEPVHVTLTENGMRKYRQILHNRPAFDAAEAGENGEIKMTFSCSAEQAMYYFLQFGKDAVIISPQSLHERMLTIYQSAEKAYM